MTFAIIEAINVTRRDDKTERIILDSASLSVNAGESVGLIGPSGSGKSSMLRSLARLDPVLVGCIRFQGTAITGNAIPAFRRQVAYLSQRPFLIEGTVEQNVSLPFSFASATGSFNRQTAIELLGVLGRRESILDQDAMTLSGGEQQSVALVRAMLIEPAVLLLDEPTASLDTPATQRFENLANIWKLADADRTWIWTSHDADQVARMTSRTVQMLDGKIVNE